MISDISLKFGRVPGASPAVINTTPITVFVGPNNSGKSRVLSELEGYCRSGQKSAGALVLDSVSFTGLDPEHVNTAIEKLRSPAAYNESLSIDHIFVASRYGRQAVPLPQLQQVIQSPSNNLHAYCNWFLRHCTLALDGNSRINLVQQQSAGDLQRPAESSLQVLFRDDLKRGEVRRILHEAFGSYFVIDPTHIGQLRIRLSPTPPASAMEERGIHAEAVAFHSKAQPIEMGSDGVKAFTGIIMEILAGDPRVMLIDEPEAFLHPALASKLGYEISKAAISSNKRIFISTHSPTFVMGCIQSGAPVTIVRLTYRAGISTARILPSSEILHLMRNPLLRSTGVLSGLFYECVVVTESDTDRAFYQEINERLVRFKPDWGIPNCLFINAQNKQTIHTILKPLRHLGIPAVGIVDVDVIKDGGKDWINLLNGASVPEISHAPLGQYRAAIKHAVESSGKDMKREGGISILQPSEKEAAESLFKQLGDYGIFVVPNGELESWLRHLSVTTHGPSWLISIFEKMGSDSSRPTYTMPGEDDVWRFISMARTWLMDANRKGIPA